ncbi:MAG TPA: hypothetical protein PK366_06725 [Fibrobacteraceae bacterium]|nr:hypothetical protein [Fibrobacteraceae bacterium]
MSHPVTLMNIKQPILDLVKHEFQSKLKAPDKGPQEFHLLALGKEYKADFAYRINTGGWCFIEDDSHGTCLSNLLKYSAWIEETNPDRPIWVFHIISPRDSAWIRLCYRESARLNKTLQGFKHVIITTPDWPKTTPKWLDDLKCEMMKM